MKTSLKWLKSLVPEITDEPQEFADKMTLSGSKVETVEILDKDLDKIVVGKIEKILPHPDADKLIICKVNIGEEEPITIVTGAPNVSEGDLVPTVLVGGKVSGDHFGEVKDGGIKIKKGKLRGVESFGMMCSIEELGSSRDYYPEAPEDGVYIFNKDVKPGDDAIEALGLDDAVVEYEITSNRVDCFSVLGLAREASATYGHKFEMPAIKECGNDEKASDYIKVTIKDSDLCSRYVARVVKNIKIGPSPWWMQRRLAAHGIRPINNLVDITNYVMEEYGQPMHAYDLDSIAKNEIIVRRANDGETFTTLDGQVRQVDNDVLMICDGEKPVGLAGIMGGENSMITDNVSTVLFEAACFDGTNIRLSSKKVGLRTDASSKFEKGLDPNNAYLAINRACELIEMLSAGEVVGGCVDVYPNKHEGNTVPFETDKINKLLGTDIAKEDMLKIFDRLSLDYDKESNEIIIPTFRQDLKCMADLAEEVARFYGYDKIPTTLPSGEATLGRLSYKLRIEKIARNVAEFCGYSQGMSYSFESPKVFDKLLIPEDDEIRRAITISNPLGEDFSIMRTISLNGILSSLSLNYNHRNKAVKLYELGNIYIPEELPLTKLPQEKMMLTLGMYGDGDFYNMKGVVEELLEQFGMKDLIELDANCNRPYLHPGRKADIIYHKQNIGYIGEIHPQVASNYDIKARVYVAVIDMQAICDMATFDRKYVGIAKFPAVTRDISLVVPKNIMAGQIEAVIRQIGSKMLESYRLFDIYEGDQLEEGYKSYAYTITFRAQDRTLEDGDVTPVMDKILNKLKDYNINIRQ